MAATTPVQRAQELYERAAELAALAERLALESGTAVGGEHPELEALAEKTSQIMHLLQGTARTLTPLLGRSELIYPSLETPDTMYQAYDRIMQTHDLGKKIEDLKELRERVSTLANHSENSYHSLFQMRNDYDKLLYHIGLSLGDAEREFAPPLHSLEDFNFNDLDFPKGDDPLLPTFEYEVVNEPKNQAEYQEQHQLHMIKLSRPHYENFPKYLEYLEEIIKRSSGIYSEENRKKVLDFANATKEALVKIVQIEKEDGADTAVYEEKLNEAMKWELAPFQPPKEPHEYIGDLIALTQIPRENFDSELQKRTKDISLIFFKGDYRTPLHERVYFHLQKINDKVVKGDISQATEEDLNRAAVRTAVEVAFTLLKLGIENNGKADADQILLMALAHLEQTIKLDPKDHGGKGDNIGSRLKFAIYQSYKDKPVAGINPHDQKYEGDFGGTAFEFPHDNPEFLARKLAAVEKIEKELITAWKL